MLAPLICSFSSSSSSLWCSIFNLYKYPKKVKFLPKSESPGDSLPASNVKNSVEVVALDKQAAEGEQRQPRVLPDLQGLQVLGACSCIQLILHCHLKPVGGEDLLEGGVANVRRHPDH